LVRGGVCDQFPQPSQSLDENVFTFGDVRITVVKDPVTVAVDQVKLIVSRAGVVIEEGKVTHNKKNIGDEGLVRRVNLLACRTRQRSADFEEELLFGGD